jgi:hypothetical protein
MTIPNGEPDSALFVPLDLRPAHNAVPSAVVRRWHPEQRGAAPPALAGQRRYWGIPFRCGPADAAAAA